MINAYIRVTWGIVKWLFFIILCFVGPPFRFVFALLGGASLIVDVVCLFGLDHPFRERAFWIPAISGLVFMAIAIGIELGTEVIAWNRGMELGAAYEGTWTSRLRNTTAGLAWFSILSFAAYYGFHLHDGIEAIGEGLGLFMGIGLAVGLVSLIYQGGASIFVHGGTVLEGWKVRFSRNASSIEAGNVVPFRKK